MTNWKTTLGGLLLAIGTAALGAPIPENYKWIPGVVSAIGGGLLGMTAKDFNTHSTVKEVEVATIEKRAAEAEGK
ncbi:MAG: hypothetical protein V4563_13010 [Pseudomonadota bacterium]